MDLWHSQADFRPISHLDICQKFQIWLVSLSFLDSCSVFLFQACRSQPPGASRVPAWHGQVITEMIISAVINQTVAGSSPPWPSLLCCLRLPSRPSYQYYQWRIAEQKTEFKEMGFWKELCKLWHNILVPCNKLPGQGDLYRVEISWAIKQMDDKDIFEAPNPRRQ